MGKRIIAVIISFIIAVAVSFTAFSLDINTPDGVKASVEGVISYKSALLNADSISDFLDALSENAGDYSSDWYYIALYSYGVDCKNKKSISALKNAVDNFYKDGLENTKVTDMQRTAFALMACGEDITSVNGRNLLADCTYNREKYKELDAQGVNSLSYALLLLDSKKFKIPKNSDFTRESLVDKILSYELENGGYALFGNGADVDITSIVLQALAPYKTNSKVKKSIDKCLEILSKRQDSTGAFKSFSGKITAESTAQVILALTSLNINPVSDSRFIKDGNTALNGLERFKMSDGGYCHMEGLSTNSIASYQCLCALVSVYKLQNGRGVFFDFSDKTKPNTKKVSKIISLKNKRVKKKDNSKKEKSVLKSASKSSTIKNSRISYNSNTENKTESKSSKTKKSFNINTTQVTTAPSDTAGEIVSVPENKPVEKSSSKPETLYLSAALLFIAYIAVIALKSRGKK